MTSSDSGEDFESADEDFDFEETESSNKETSFKCSELCDDVAEVRPAEPPDKYTDQIDQRLNNMKLENKPFPTYAGCDTQDVEKLENCDKTKPKHPKKLGTKLICNKTIDSPLVSSIDKEGDAQEKKGDDDDLNVKTVHRKNNDGSISNQNVKGTTAPDNCLKEFVSKSEKSSLEKSQLSDGWDFEEEDGFAIPSTLARANQEQTSRVNTFGDKDEQEQGWGGWGAWGVSSLLTTATDSVSTFSNQVTAGLSTVLETTVGAPDPETLAAATRLQQNTPLESKKVEETSRNEDEKVTGNYGGFGSLVSGVSFLGSSVINRGLDTLESLGKKTMEVLQEGDPGLKKKRAMLFSNPDKLVLSQILREAKEKAEHSDKEKEEKETARKAHFESLFDDFQGMIHLEALEMLSTQCELKLQSMILGESGTALDDLQETLSQVRDLCELPDEEDESEVLTRDQFTEQVTKCIDGLRIKISAVKIIQVNDGVISRLDKLGCESESATVVHQTAISSLAEFTAAAMECFHKSAELLLAKSLHNTADEADYYVQLTGLLCGRVSGMANEFTQLLTKYNPIANSLLITNIFLEASNSCSYTKNACQLLVPILQVGAVSS